MAGDAEDKARGDVDRAEIYRAVQLGNYNCRCALIQKLRVKALNSEMKHTF